jgi:hypothetical protein
MTQLTTTAARVRIEQTIPTVEQTVTVRAQPSAQAGYLLVADQDWTWRELRDFVVAEIERLHGVWPRNQTTEYGIFNSFVTRWSAVAPWLPARIAKTAFGPVYQGMWMNAPISVNRFAKNSDGSFGVPLAEKIIDAMEAVRENAG